MNGLVQQESTLIGTKKDIDALKNSSSATLLVVSDSHGDTDTLIQIVEQFGSESDALVFCGDGFSDVMSLIEEAFTNDKQRQNLPPVIACVQGNGDASFETIFVKADETEKDGVDGYCEYSIKRELRFTVAGRVVFLVHGNRHGVDSGVDMLSSSAYSADADLVFYGHSHLHFRDDIAGTLFLNPGSCSRPRGGQVASFAVVSFPGDRERYDADFFCIRKNLFGTCEFTSLDLI